MDILLIILLLGLAIIVFVVFNRIGFYDMTYIRSDFDNELYMVRNRKDKKKAANLLARIKHNIHGITKYMYEKLQNPKTNNLERYKEFSPYILQLHEKIKNVVVKESASNSVYTSYTVNKGEQIIFCIRSKVLTKTIESNDLHDINLLMYVALHEISHVACPEYNHTPLFKKIFKFICEEGIEMGIYQKIDFNTNPEEYCGMNITDTVI
jgi:hypothetical protein